MLEGFIGREKLQKGLQQYLGKYKYSNAQTNDLWNSLSQASFTLKKIPALHREASSASQYCSFKITLDVNYKAITKTCDSHKEKPMNGCWGHKC